VLLNFFEESTNAEDCQPSCKHSTIAQHPKQPLQILLIDMKMWGNHMYKSSIDAGKTKKFWCMKKGIAPPIFQLIEALHPTIDYLPSNQSSRFHQPCIIEKIKTNPTKSRNTK